MPHYPTGCNEVVANFGVEGCVSLRLSGEHDMLLHETKHIQSAGWTRTQEDGMYVLARLKSFSFCAHCYSLALPDLATEQQC